MKFCNCFKNFCNENAISILISNIIQAESELCTILHMYKIQFI